MMENVLNRNQRKKSLKLMKTNLHNYKEDWQKIKLTFFNYFTILLLVLCIIVMTDHDSFSYTVSSFFYKLACQSMPMIIKASLKSYFQESLCAMITQKMLTCSRAGMCMLTYPKVLQGSWFSPSLFHPCWQRLHSRMEKLFLLAWNLSHRPVY